VSSVSVGGQALTKVKSITGPNSYSMDVYRLVKPVTGSGKTITVTHSKVGYDPVRVSVFSVRGASTSSPNGAMPNIEITPATAIATKKVSIPSTSGALTISAVMASGMYVNTTGVVPTPGYQTLVAGGAKMPTVDGA
jgi:hypothetical protein